MDGELDLELYTISIIRLNNAFQKLEDNEYEAIEMFKDSTNDLKELYDDILNDLNQDEVNYGDYYPFFEYVQLIFPRYIKELRLLENETLDELIEAFENINKLANYYILQNGIMIK